MPLDVTQWATTGEQAGQLEAFWGNLATILGILGFILIVITLSIGNDGKIVQKVRSFTFTLSFLSILAVAAIILVAPMSPSQDTSFNNLIMRHYDISSFQYNGSTNKEVRCFLNRPCVTAESLPAEGEYDASWIKDSEQISGKLKIEENQLTLIGPDNTPLTPER